MSLLAMPLVIINMGGEMVYILEQRLNAQGIATDKGTRVLLDICNCMFNAEYMNVMFQPQEVYTMPSVRKIFERMAHSSIMRLSQTSMDKLFDLMVMGFKYQLVCSASLDSIMQVTMMHLSQLRGMISGLQDSSACLKMLEAVENKVRHTYEGLGYGAKHLLRQTLLRFFQDRKVKVSLFLQEGIQSSSGRLILHNPGGSKVGSVTTYTPSGQPDKQEKLKLKALEFELAEFFIHPAALGTNLYSVKRQKVVPPTRKGDVLTAPLLPSDELKLAGEDKHQYAEDYRLTTQGQAAKQELGLLSSLLAIKPESDNFKLTILDDTGDSPSKLGKGISKIGQVDSLLFEQDGKSYKAGMIAALKLDDKSLAPSAKRQEEDELLDLLGD